MVTQKESTPELPDLCCAPIFQKRLKKRTLDMPVVHFAYFLKDITENSSGSHDLY